MPPFDSTLKVMLIAVLSSFHFEHRHIRITQQIMNNNVFIQLGNGQYITYSMYVERVINQ